MNALVIQSTKERLWSVCCFKRQRKRKVHPKRECSAICYEEEKVLLSIWSIIYGGAGDGRHLRGIRRHRPAHPQPQGNTAGNIRENFIHRSSGTLCSWSRFSDVKIPHSALCVAEAAGEFQENQCQTLCCPSAQQCPMELNGHCPFSVELDLLCLYQGIYTCYFRGHFFKSNSSM